MTRDSFDSYSHGDAGSEPSSSLDFSANDKPDPQNFDWYWNSVINAINGHADEFGRLDSDDDGVVDAADQLETGGTTAVVRDTTNSQDVLRGKEGGNVEIPNGNLRLDTGQSIEDGSGTERISTTSSRTRIKNGNGFQNITADTDATTLTADSGIPIKFYDNGSGFIALQYENNGSVGLFRTPRASVVIESTATEQSDGLQLDYNNPHATVRARSGGSYSNLRFAGSLYDFSDNPANLRLADGKAIEDESGQNRLHVRDPDTRIVDGNGFIGLRVLEGYFNEIRSNSTTPIIFRDKEGGFDAVKYITSSSAPGTLELTNAQLDMRSANHSISWNPVDGTERPTISVDGNGEVWAEDDSGNRTTLT